MTRNQKHMCLVDACHSPVRTRGYCDKHYRRLLRHGNPLAGNAPHGAARAWLQAHVAYDGDECLIWPFARLQNGYGVLRVTAGQRCQQIASRAMCEAVYGPPPASWYEAAHTCGNGAGGCVNPKHLRWSTPADNRRDKKAHGTQVAGERHYKAKLTDKDVEMIRAMKGRVVQSHLARAYGVAPSLISRIMNNRDRVA